MSVDGVSLEVAREGSTGFFMFAVLTHCNGWTEDWRRFSAVLRWSVDFLSFNEYTDR